jgi:maltooligosyltrehalose synthase
MRWLLVLSLLAATLPANAARDNTHIVDAVLASNHITDLAERLQRRADDTRFGTDIPMSIFAAVAKRPADEKAWRAAYRYHSMTDAGFSLMFNWTCFDTLLEHPTLFRDRYVGGDDRAVELMRCAMWSDGSARWGNLYGAVTHHGFRDVASYRTALFATLTDSGASPRNEREALRRHEFIERAKKDLADAERKMDRHAPKS